MASNNSIYDEQISALKGFCKCNKNHEKQLMTAEKIQALEEAQRSMYEHTAKLAEQRANENNNIRRKVLNEFADIDKKFDHLICEIHEEPNTAVRRAFGIKRQLNELLSLING